MLIQRIPAPLQQQRVTRLQRRLRHPDILAISLDAQHDQVAAVRHHPREDTIPDIVRPWRDDDLRHAKFAIDEPALQRGRARLLRPDQPVVGGKRPDVVLAPPEHDARGGIDGLVAHRHAPRVLDADDVHLGMIRIADLVRRETEERRLPPNEEDLQLIARQVLTLQR